MSDDYTIPNLASRDFDNIREDLVGGWWCRESCGPHAVAPGMWWVSSLAVRDGHLRLFLTQRDAREWAAQHDWIRDAYRPERWIEDLFDRLNPQER